MAVEEQMMEVQQAQDAGAACVSAYVSELDGLSALIQQLSHACFAEQLQGQSPIGAHVRHCLDHSQALINGLDNGLVDYEQRHRGVVCESDPAIALGLIAEVRSAIASWGPDELGRAVTVNVIVHETLAAQQYPSTVLRELLFLLAHQHHHHATIAAIAKAEGVDVPRFFPLAPSTRAAVLAEEAKEQRRSPLAGPTLA